ncbi:major histocompatibility complex class I-related gene protein-like [Clupea harengus]|uniref:Major histocompatibility complex class I-related gene protein-like n=1 Tax=Clupea harengus TaxID=7950 RepID=A0A6P8G165_CLUHA|nr:major histocompatibility complex class I-related gene protein-like [Clupea harengus]
MLKHVMFLLVFHQCLADVHSLHRRCAATQGNSYPKNIQFLMVDDIMVYYYISAGKEPSIPKWLNHSEGIFLWGEIRRNLNYNRFIMDTAVRLTSERFNHSHDHIYQAHGRCDYKDEYISSAMSHAYDGKDFVSFDVESNTWVAAVPEAQFYKRKREDNIEDLHRLIHSYKYGCIDWLKKLLLFSQEERKEKVPDVVLIEKSSPGSSDTAVTCHVTGFYPRAVQVEWLNQEGHILDRVSSGEVLPNGDGTYQISRTLSVPDGARWSQIYRCQVVHSSVTGHITVEWEPNRSFFIPLIVGCSVFTGVSVLVLILYIKKISICSFAYMGPLRNINLNFGG